MTGLPTTHVTVREAAAELRLSERTLWQLIGTGELESFKLCGRRMVPVDAIARYVEAERLAWQQRPRPGADVQNVHSTRDPVGTPVGTPGADPDLVAAVKSTT